jgi:transposase
MAYEEITALLGGWPGFVLVAVEREPAAPPHRPARIRLELAPAPDVVRTCSRCGQPVAEVHELTRRWVRDLPILDADTWLVVPRARVRCPRCGPAVEAIAWLDRYARLTTRFAESIARLCGVLPIKHVAAWFRVGWDTVKQIDRRALARRLGPVSAASLAGVRVVALDEFALHRGQRYATVALEPDTRRVLWVGRGARREDVRPFFALLGTAGRAALEAVVMDMNAAFEAEVRAQCPHVAIVFDLFHVAAKYGHEVLDRVRVDEANRVSRADRADPRTTALRRVIKGTRWLLLRNRAHVTRPADRVRLRELLAANKALCTAYVLKDDLKHLWDYRSVAAARRFWRDWYHRAVRSRIPALVRFAKRLAPYAPGILAHCRWPLHTSVLEGVNNKIKVLKRMAYGFRDDDYFFLKIRAAFPGIPG